jgi:hypothetical protein
MSDSSPRLALPLIQPSQAQKHVTHNEAIDRLDALVQLSVVAFEAETPPALPAEGQCWALAAMPAGAWAGHGGQIARWRNGGWDFIAPADGWIAWGETEAEVRVRSAGSFAALAGSGGGGGTVPSLLANLTGVGVETTPDAINRLAVVAPATLFSHAGAGHQLKINKAAATDTASLLFQTGFSGRAEFGLAGNDDFSVKVSADGSSFAEVLRADAASGRVGFPAGVRSDGFALRDPANPARSASFDAAGLTPGAARSLALPDRSGTLALTGGPQVFSGAHSFADGLTLGALAADPAGAVDGQIWLNGGSGQIRARIGGLVRNLAANDMAVMVPPPGEVMMTTNGAGNSTATQAGASGRLDLFPYMARADVAIDALIVNVTTLIAGALGRIVAYAADANGRPDQLILESADLDFGSTGNKTATVALTLRQGVTTWFGIRHSGAAVLSAWQPTATPDLNGGSPATQARKVLRRSLAFATPAPSSWGYLASELSNGSATAIWMRVA